MNWPSKFWTEGFETRTFLTKEEWEAYLRNYPVRFIDPSLRQLTCEVCGITNDIPLQLAHIIPFEKGIRYFALTPFFLNGNNNIKTAHRGKCNKTVELNFTTSIQRLKLLGIKELPQFLPANILASWQSL